MEIGVSEIDVKKVAMLARLGIDPKDEQHYKDQFEAIFKYFEDINAINTDGVEPLVTPTDLAQNLRVDKKESHFSGDEALSNAPDKSGNLFKVPPVV